MTKMLAKVISLVVIITVTARPQGGQDHGHHHDHGHAFSSQSIVHHSHHHPVHHEKHEHHHEKHGRHHENHGHESHHGHKESHGHKKSHGYGHAFSSQSIVMHHGHHTPVHIEHKHHEAPKHEKEEKHHQHHHHHHVDYYTHPKYKYDYKVEDPHTGDHKQHHETQEGDVVKGFYSLHEPDGTVRIVEYSADKHTGFHAVVRHEGHPHHHH